MRTIRFDFVGRLDGRTELGDGSVRFNARLTRTGVFDYGDHKELRKPEDVFAPAALDSFRGLAVTEGHKDFITADNWRQHAVGHVGDDVKQDGKFVAGSVVVKDPDVLKKIDAGDLQEISMGYTVDLDDTPGEHPEEGPYDAVQKNIRGNHAALGPANWARAGSSARLLDGAAYPPDMVEATKNVPRIDAPPANADQATSQTQKDLEASRAENDFLRLERDHARADAAEQRKRADTAEAERDAAKKDVEKARADADPAKVDARVAARVALVTAAALVLGAEFKADGKTDRDIRVASLVKVDPKFDASGKSDDYLAAAFDLALNAARADRSSLADVNKATVEAPKADAETESPVEKAQREMRERNLNAWRHKK